MPKSTNWRAELDEDSENAFYTHFPILKSMVRDTAAGRYAGILRKFAEDAAFMNEWDIKMRYAPREAISVRLVERWRSDAFRVIEAMEEC